MDLGEAKRKARVDAGTRRAAAHLAHSEGASEALARRGLPFATGPDRRVVTGFFPHKSEISVLPLLARLAGEGWRPAMPVVVGEGKPLVFRAWEQGGATEPGVWGIPVPPACAAELVPDVLLVPMLAFDAAGYRLGYGGGFYDRTLAKLRGEKEVIAIGVAYAGQAMDSVPHGPTDQRLDYIMTEEATRPCG
mgnify:CR=1 FL=1